MCWKSETYSLYFCFVMEAKASHIIGGEITYSVNLDWYGQPDLVSWFAYSPIW